MPTYDYQCDACDHTFELFQGINAPVETVCPKCNQPKLRRLIGTGAAVVFKGSGFYQTDYRTDGYKKSAAADKTSTSTPTSDSTSSGSKPTDSPKPKASESSGGTSTGNTGSSSGTAST